MLLRRRVSGHHEQFLCGTSCASFHEIECTMETLERFCVVVLFLSFFSASNSWLPRQNPIRGVNLGGLFVAEPWMMEERWESMGCGGQKDEWSCVIALGQSAANAAFQEHWSTWITEEDIKQIASLGLNTVRIPLGFWLREDLVASNERFPQGGFAFLERVCRWASDEGLYIILDLHAAPGAQSRNQQFTGHSTDDPQFYNSYNYDRAYRWLEWITLIRYSNHNFSNVGAVEILNEPFHVSDGSEQATAVIDTYYPNAWQRIRAVEDQLGISKFDRLHIQMMDARWGSGDPNEALRSVDPKRWFALYDDHHYLKWDVSVDTTREAYMRHACSVNVGGDSPVVVGEWSLTVRDEDSFDFDITRSDAVAWYGQFFAAQVISYEKQRGWVFWSWKTDWIDGRLDWRWSYQQAVRAGVIPSNPREVHNTGACQFLRPISSGSDRPGRSH